jgi:hypothetical protein
MQRPTGITILAILAIIAGIFGLLAGLADFGLGSLRVLGGSATLRPGVAGIGLVTIVGAFFVLIGAVLSLAFGIGALNLSGWAWTLGVVGEILHLVGYALRLVRGVTPIASLIGIMFAAGILFYLYQQHVRAAFGKT